MADEKTGLVKDPTEKNGGPGAKPRKGQLLTPEQLQERMSQGVPDYFAPSQNTSIIQTGIEPSKYDHRYTPYQGDLNRYRAYEQGPLDEFGNALGRFALNTVPGIIGNTAAAFDLFNGDEMGNDLTRAMNEVKRGVNDMLPIYRKNPGTPLDIGDSAWWMENGSALMSSAVEFLVPGAAISKALRATKLLGWLGKLPGGARTRAFGEGLATNYLLNNAEGVITAMDVYDQVLSDQTIPESKRKKIASDAASYALNMNKVNILLNMSSTMAFLKPLRHSRGIAKDFTTKAALRSMAGESVQEYAEEVINHLSVEEGKRYANALKKEEGYSMTPENIIKDVFSLEGIEAGLLGAVGGTVQTAGQRFGLDNMKTNNQVKRDENGDPVRKMDEDGNVIPGEYEYEKVSNNDIKRRQWAEYTQKLEGLQKTLKANNVGDAVEAFKKASNQQANLYLIDTLEAISDPSMTQSDREKVINFRINNLPGNKKNQARMRNELDSLKKLSALELDKRHRAYREKTLASQAYDFFEARGAEGLINEYGAIANLSKEEAEERGLDPERYQDDAREAVEIIKQAEREYNKIADITEDDVVRRELYNNRVDTFQLDRQISSERTRLVDLKTDYEAKKDELMGIMNDGLKEGDNDWVTEEEMLDEYFADEKDALDRSRRRVEELIDRRRKGVESYKKLKDPKNHEQIKRDKTQRLRELIQDALEKLNFEKTMSRLAFRNGGENGETKFNNMMGTVKRWRGRWMFVPRGQENEAGIAGIEITRDNYRDFLGLTSSQVREEDLRTEEGRARLALLDAMEQHLKSGRAEVARLEKEIAKDEKEIIALNNELQKAIKDLEAYTGDKRHKPYRKLKKQLQDLRQRNEDLISKKQESLASAQLDIDIIQFAVDKIQSEYDYALENIDRDGYEAIADRLKAQVNLMPFTSDYQGNVTNPGYGRAKELRDKLTAISEQEQALSRELQAKNDNFEMLTVSEEYIETMQEMVITMEAQLTELENYRNAIDEIINRYGDLPYDGSDKAPSLYALLNVAAMGRDHVETVLSYPNGHPDKLFNERQVEWFDTTEGQRFLNDIEAGAFINILNSWADTAQEGVLTNVIENIAENEVATLSDALMPLNDYISEYAQKVDDAINRYAELVSEQEVLDAIKVDSEKVKALRNAVAPIYYTGHRFSDVLSMARDLVKKYREEAKLLDQGVKDTKPGAKEQEVDYTEDLDDLQRINNILFGGKFKHTLFSTTGNDRDKEVVRFNRFLARNRKSLLKDYAIEFHTVESAREAGLTSLFSKEQLDIDEQGGDRVIKAVFVDKNGNPAKIDPDGMIGDKGAFYATAVIHTPSYDRVNPVAVLNEYLADNNSPEQVENEADLATKVIVDPVSGNSMNAEDLAKVATGNMQRQLKAMRDEIVAKINNGERAFVRPNFISGGVPMRSNPMSGGRVRESLVGTFVDQLDDIEDIKVISEGEIINVNGKRVQMRLGSVLAINKDGDAIDVVPRKLKNDEVDLVIDLLDFLLNTTKQKLSSQVESISSAGEFVEFREIAKSSEKYRLLDQLLYFGLNSNDLFNKRAIYFYQGKLVFGDKAIFTTDIKKSKELRQFLADKFHHISESIADFHKKFPDRTYYHPVKVENGKVIVKAYEPKGDVDGYTRYLVEEKVAASDLTPTSSKAIDNFRHRYVTFETAIKTDLEAFFPKPKPKAKKAPAKKAAPKARVATGTVLGNSPEAAAAGAVKSSRKKRKKGSSYKGGKSAVSTDQLKRAFEQEGKGEIFDMYDKINKKAAEQFPGGLGAMASMGPGMVEDVVKSIAKGLGFNLSENEAKEIAKFKKEVSNKRKELKNAANTGGQEDSQENSKARKTKRKQSNEESSNEAEPFQVAGEDNNTNTNPDESTQEDDSKEYCEGNWL